MHAAGQQQQQPSTNRSHAFEAADAVVMGSHSMNFFTASAAQHQGLTSPGTSQDSASHPASYATTTVIPGALFTSMHDSPRSPRLHTNSASPLQRACSPERMHGGSMMPDSPLMSGKRAREQSAYQRHLARLSSPGRPAPPPSAAAPAAPQATAGGQAGARHAPRPLSTASPVRAASLSPGRASSAAAGGLGQGQRQGMQDVVVQKVWDRRRAASAGRQQRPSRCVNSHLGS